LANVYTNGQKVAPLTRNRRRCH